MLPITPRTRDLLAVLLLLLLPLVLLAECVFGDKHYMPFDRAEFPPVATKLTTEQVQALQVGANYDATEPPIWFDPEMRLIRRGLAEGVYPHWNPYVRGGAPLVANGHLGLFNPLHWPAFLFEDPADGLLYLTYAVLALAGLLMYGLLRELACSRVGSLFGAVAFALSGTLTANAHWYMRVEPIALLPGLIWALLRVDRATGSRRGLAAACFAVQLALVWTAGFPPFAVVVTLFAGLVATVLLVLRWHKDGLRTAAPLAGWALTGLILGLGLAAVQMLQMVEFYPFANRTPQQTLADQSQFAFDPMGLLGYLLPDAFAHPSSRIETGGRSPLAFLLFSRTEWTTGAPLLPDRNYNFTEYSVFAGIAPFALALLGLATRGPTWRLVAGGGLLVAMLLAIGPWPFFYLHALPGIESVPPFRFAAVGCAFVAALAALGMDRLLLPGKRAPLLVLSGFLLVAGGTALSESQSLASHPEQTEERWLETITERYRPMSRQFDPNLPPEAVTPQLVQRFLFTAESPAGGPVDRLSLARIRLERNLDRAGWSLLLMAGVVAAIGLLGNRRKLSWLAAPILLATTLDLGAHGASLNHGRELPYPLDSAVRDYLRQRRDELAPSGGIMVARANPDGGEAMHMPPGSLAEDRIRDLHFYTFLDGRSGLPMKALYGETFLHRDHFVHALPDDEKLKRPWWDAVGLRFLLTTGEMNFAGNKVGPDWAGPGGEFYIYERPNALPRAWVVPDIRSFDRDEDLIQAAISRDFEPRRHALVSSATAAALAMAEHDEACSERGVEVTFENLKRLHVRVADGPAGFLVVADTALPGWSATTNGAPAEIHEANVYQRLIRLPAGPCVVEFSYRTPGLGAGSTISLLALLMVGWLVRRARRTSSD